jgi:hypothetical protein
MRSQSTLENLRYRGNNRAIKDALQKQQQNEQAKQTLVSPSSTPSGAGVASSAYGLDVVLSNVFTQHGLGVSLDSIKNLCDVAATIFQQTPSALQKIYEDASLAQKNIAQTILSQKFSNTKFKTGMRSILYGMLILVYRSIHVAAEPNSTSALTFFNGTAADNMINLCNLTSANYCDQFYVTQNNNTVVFGASYITSTQRAISNLTDIIGKCGSVSNLQAFLKNQFATFGQVVLGTTTCFSAVYSHDLTMHADNQLVGVANAVCDALDQNAAAIKSCINDALSPPMNATPTTAIQFASTTSSFSPLLYLLFLSLLVCCLPATFYFAKKRQQQATENREQATQTENIEPREVKLDINESQQTPATLAPASTLRRTS